MLTETQQVIWNRIEQFQFDLPGVVFPFSRRLAQDNGWSHAFALEVLQEYKRFAFLAVVAGHPVSPSDAVDQAWHEHLTYTKSYWGEFCPNVLGQPLHHEPTQGGVSETEKFEDWYQRTLESYERIFGSRPPAHVWPSLEMRRVAAKSRFRRVDVASHWLLPKPVSSIRRLALLSPLLALFVGGCMTAFSATLNPLDFRGGEFLLFYWLCVMLAFLCAGVARFVTRRQGGSTREIPELNPFETALLVGGEARAVHAAVVQLAAAGALKTPPTEPGKLQLSGSIPSDMSMFESALLSHIPPAGTTIVSATKAMRSGFEGMRRGLEAQGLLIRGRWKAYTVAFVPIALLFLLAAAKVFVGVERHKPVVFLVLSGFVILLVWLGCFGRRLHRTRRGDRVVKELQRQHADLKTTKAYLAGDPTLALAFGLFGASILVGTPFESFHNWFFLHNSGSASGCGGSCGSSGGGGDGGGGCGGCGGGD